MLSNINSIGYNVHLSNLKSNKKNLPILKSYNTQKLYAHNIESQFYRPYFLPLSFGKNNNSSYIESKNYLKQNLNIDADFGDNKKLAGIVAEAFRTVNEELPNSLKNSGLKISLDYNVFKNRPKGKNPDGSIKELEPALLITSGSNGTLHFNPNFDWDNVEQRVHTNFEKGNLAYKEPIGLIYHEIGHFLHFQSNSAKYRAASDEIPKFTEENIINKEVSKRATKDFGEFVAEVFAKKMLKHDISDEIQKIYNDWAYYGPNIFKENNK